MHARSLTAILLFGVSATALASPASAQTAAETTAQAVTPPQGANDYGEIVVTATKRASTLQDVPFSINAQTEEDIQRANASTIEDISRNVAGLTVQNLGPGQSQVSVRGVSAGQIVRDQPGVKEQVGVYFDESVISLSLFTPDFDLFDLNRVETLRGPQGTLFGSGSVGGTIRYITNQPKLGLTEGLIEANINAVEEDDLGGHVKAAINVPLGDTAAVRVVGYGQEFAGFVDAVGPAGGKNVNDGSRAGGRVSLLWEPSPEVSITPRVVYQQIRASGFNREEVFNLYANPLTTTRPAYTFDDREQYLLLRERFKDNTLLADLTGSYDFGGVELTSVTSYIKRDILVSRDASALTGSVSDDLGFPDSGVLLPSNLRDTTELKTLTQELRLSSTGSGPFQWVVGGFYSDVERVYAQRLPTPGYDAFTDAALGAGTAAATANGFPANSPYNADLPYDIKQKAVFGEASYDFGQIALTAGARYFDFDEERDFISGGLFSNGDRRIGDKTASNGFSPRLIATFEPNNNLKFNVQAAKGFRLGGVNDPLNLPLCSDADEALFGPFAGAFDDETLWNYEAGAKYSKGPISLQRGRLPYQDQGPAGHARCRQLLVAHRLQRAQGPHHGRGNGIRRLAVQRLGSLGRGQLRLGRIRLHAPGRAGGLDRHSRRQSPAERAQVPDRRDRDLRPALQRRERMVCVRQHPACRQPLHPAVGPGKQPAHLRLRQQLRRHSDRRGHDHRPEAAVVQSGQHLGRPAVRRRARRDPLRQQPVRREPAAVVRPRTRRARAPRLQHRPAAHDRPDHPPGVQRRPAGRSGRRRRAAASTHGPGDPDLCRRIGHPGDRHVPGSGADAGPGARARLKE